MAAATEGFTRMIGVDALVGRSWRSEVIKSITENVPEAAVITMPAHDRSRYFLKTSAERFREWLGYKSTLILPLDSDLSTRLFDAQPVEGVGLSLVPGQHRDARRAALSCFPSLELVGIGDERLVEHAVARVPGSAAAQGGASLGDLEHDEVLDPGG